MFLLDTDHLVFLQRGPSPEGDRMRARMAGHPVGDFAISIVSFHEQALGWNNYISNAPDPSGVVRGYNMFQRLLTEYAGAIVLPFDDQAASRFVILRVARVRVATMDLRIASIALSRGLTLLTRNLVDFRRVPGLSVEDWTV